MDKLLIVNVFFAPQSFGGATVVAENLARELALKQGWQVTIVTTFNNGALAPYTLMRYQTQGLDVIAVNVPDATLNDEERYTNPKFTAAFANIVSALSPDVAHVHCIQNMGSGIIDALAGQQVPTAVTIHDCWWICERQFMINSHNKYCYQRKIDYNVCRFCVPEVDKAQRRAQILMKSLARSQMFLFPSRFQKNLHIENGLPEHQCRVNKNGVVLPGEHYAKSRPQSRRTKVRFGFVGGPGPIKGGELIEKALGAIEDTGYEMVVVDAATNLGRSWKGGLNWDIPGKLTIVPGYTQETMDRFFSKIDVLLFPSQWKESFGLTVREALARDVWVIATDGGGTVEDCVDGVNSTIIPLVNDHGPLQKAVEDCLKRDDWNTYQNPKKANIWGIEKQAEHLSGFLRELISEPRAVNSAPTSRQTEPES